MTIEDMILHTMGDILYEAKIKRLKEAYKVAPPLKKYVYYRVLKKLGVIMPYGT